MEKIFNGIENLDIRVNVRLKGNPYDNKTNRYGHHYYVLDKNKSIVWRWNHPKNPKSQFITRGYPTKKLWKDAKSLFDKKPELEKQLIKEACEYYCIPVFSVEDGKNYWEKGFLSVILNNMINRKSLSDKQLNTLRGIIEPTPGQIKCIKGLGRTVRDGLTKIEASRMITELKGN